MDKEQALKVLKQQIENVGELKNKGAFPPKYAIWESTILKALSALFNAEEVKLFKDINPDRMAWGDDDHYIVYLEVLEKKEEMLKGLIGEYERFVQIENSSENKKNNSRAWTRDQIENIADEYWANKSARCPCDRALLDIREMRAIGKATADLVIQCPRCGFHSFWPIRSKKLEEKKVQVIPAGKEFTARKVLKDILKVAKNKLQIIDPHFKEEDAFSLLLGLPNSVKIEIIISGKTSKSSFLIDLNKFQKEWGGSIEIKTNSGLHGRHIIIDGGNEVYVVDHSLKDAGTALTCIHKPEETKEIIAHFNDKWNTGTLIS